MYRWKICELRWKDFGETVIDNRHKMYFSAKDVMGCQPILNRFITIPLKASPLNITVIQVYGLMSDQEDSLVEEFARYNNIVLANALGPQKASWRWTWHSPSGDHHNQIDYILVQRRSAVYKTEV